MKTKQKKRNIYKFFIGKNKKIYLLFLLLSLIFLSVIISNYALKNKLSFFSKAQLLPECPDKEHRCRPGCFSDEIDSSGSYTCPYEKFPICCLPNPATITPTQPTVSPTPKCLSMCPIGSCDNWIVYNNRRKKAGAPLINKGYDPITDQVIQCNINNSAICQEDDRNYGQYNGCQVGQTVDSF